MLRKLRSEKIAFNKIDGTTYDIVVELKGNSYRVTLEIDWSSYLSSFGSFKVDNLYVQHDKWMKTFYITLEANIFEYGLKADLFYCYNLLDYSVVLEELSCEGDTLDLREVKIHRDRERSSTVKANSSGNEFVDYIRNYDPAKNEDDEIPFNLKIEKR